MSNTNTEVLTTAYEKLQGALTQSNTVLPKLEEAVKNADLSNYATVSDLEDKASKVDLNTANARIDSFTTLAEGSTTGDAELIDARTVNGTTYTNVGGAVRAISSGEALQNEAVEGIKVNFNVGEYQPTLNLFDKHKITRNSYINTSGDIVPPIDGTIRSVSDFISVEPNGTYTSSAIFTHSFYFDRNHNKISGTYNSDERTKLIVPDNSDIAYVRFTVRDEYIENFSFEKGDSAKSGRIAMTPVIEEESIMKSHLNFSPVEKVPSINLFNKETVEKNKYVKWENGTIGTPTIEGTFYASDFIEVEPNTSYFMTTGYQTAFYDENKVYISGKSEFTSPIVTPSTAKYMRTTVTSDINSFQITKSEKELSYVNHFITDIDENSIGINKFSENAKALISPFYGKTINFIGDSITYGYNSGVGDRVSKPYPTIVGEILGCNIRNYGINGSTIHGNDTVGYKPIVQRYSDMEDADCVVVAAGTNDFGSDKRVRNIGTIDSTDVTTFYGALNVLCNGLIEKYLGKEIVFITPIPRETETNHEGLELIQFVNAIKEVCNQHNIPVLDLYHTSNFHVTNEAFKNTYSPDGLHGTQAWYYIHARKVANFINNQ